MHPGTGRVCVPIDTRTLDEFDPFTVPTVTELLEQIDEWDEKNKGDSTGEGEGSAEKKMQDWEKTKLKPYVDYFRAFVQGLLKEEKNGKREREDGAASAAADPMEF